MLSKIKSPYESLLQHINKLIKTYHFSNAQLDLASTSGVTLSVTIQDGSIVNAHDLIIFCDKLRSLDEVNCFSHSNLIKQIPIMKPILGSIIV